MPLSLAFDDHDEERTRALAGLAVTKVRQQAEIGLIADAMADEDFCRALVSAIGEGKNLRTDGGSLRFSRGQGIQGEWSVTRSTHDTPLHRLTTSSNSISLLGERLFLKAYRRLQPGMNPELEMGRFLTDVAQFKHSVPVAGSVEWVDADGEVWTLALLQAQMPNQGDAWSATVDQLKRLLESSVRRVPTGCRRSTRWPSACSCWRGAWPSCTSRWRSARGDAAFDPEPMLSRPT